MANLRDLGLEKLSQLIGLKLSAAGHAADCRTFQFGGPPGGKGKYALHLLCSWRLDDATHILTGLSDWYLPATSDRPADEGWDPAKGGSLQEAVLREVMNDVGSPSRVIVNKTASLVVTSVSVDPYGGFSLELSGGLRLTAFPGGSRDEHWRLLQFDATGKDFVVEGTGAYEI